MGALKHGTAVGPVLRVYNDACLVNRRVGLDAGAGEAVSEDQDDRASPIIRLYVRTDYSRVSYWGLIMRDLLPGPRMTDKADPSLLTEYRRRIDVIRNLLKENSDSAHQIVLHWGAGAPL